MKHLAILAVLALGSFAAPSALAVRIPQSTNEYYFTRVPDPQYIGESRRSMSPSTTRDLLECYPTFTATPGDVKIYGYVKQYPINGKAINDKLFRHENCAYFSECFNERAHIDGNGKYSLVTTSCRDKNVLDNPDFSFTNNYLASSCTTGYKMNEQSGKMERDEDYQPAVYDDVTSVPYDDDGNPRYISDLNISLAHPVINYTKPNITGKPLKLVGTYDKLLQAFMGFQSGIWFNKWNYNFHSMFDYHRRYRGYVGTYPSGNWAKGASGGDEFTPNEVSTTGTPDESDWTSSNFSINWSYYHSKHWQWYLKNWNKDYSRYTSYEQGLHTEQFSDDCTDVDEDSEFAYVGTGMSTNNVCAGGIDRFESADMFSVHYFYVSFYSANDDGKLEDWDKLVVIPDIPVSVHKGGDVGCDDDDNCWPTTKQLVLKPSQSIRSMAMLALKACGLEWKQEIEADEPDPFDEDDLPRLASGPDWSHRHSGYHTKNANLYMSVQHYGVGLCSFRVNFTSP